MGQPPDLLLGALLVGNIGGDGHYGRNALVAILHRGFPGEESLRDAICGLCFFVPHGLLRAEYLGVPGGCGFGPAEGEVQLVDRLANHVVRAPCVVDGLLVRY